MVRGKIKTNPIAVRYSPEIEQCIEKLIPRVKEVIGDAYPARWVALRLLDGDMSLLQALQQQPLPSVKEVSIYACHDTAKSV
jgi:Fe2+ transport system protein B